MKAPEYVRESTSEEILRKGAQARAGDLHDGPSEVRFFHGTSRARFRCDAVVGDAVPLFDESDAIADLSALAWFFAQNANCYAPAALDIDDCYLIGSIRCNCSGGE